MGELSEEAKAEITEAVRILKTDGVHIHKSYAAFRKAQDDAAKTPPAPTGEGKPPPVKENPEPDYDEIVGLWGTKRVPKAKAPDAPPAA